MNVEGNVLQVEHLSQMSFNDLLSLYRQGYRLGQSSNIGIGSGNIRSMATCKGVTCPCSVTTGGTLTLSASVSSGTAPYTYHWSITKPDGSSDTSLTGASNSYTFAQNGNYTVSVYVTDTCTSGAKTSNTDSCVITASSGGVLGYNCSNCNTPVIGGTYPTTAACQIACVGGGGGGGGGGCDVTICPPDKNYCVGGSCIPKKYVLYAGIGIAGLFVISILK